jgi:hypothetical protein
MKREGQNSRKGEVLEKLCATSKGDVAGTGRKQMVNKEVDSSTYSSRILSTILIVVSQVIGDTVAFLLSHGDGGMRRGRGLHQWEVWISSRRRLSNPGLSS